MCVDYSDLNHMFPKDLYPVLNIYKLVDSLVEYNLLSFMDAYSGYNQISMYDPKKQKTTFTIKRPNYQYIAMLVGLENVWETYYRMMNEIFK